MSIRANKKKRANDKEPKCSKLYYCEGLIKEVRIEEMSAVTFRIDPASPYIFEKMKDNGSTERCLLFVDNVQKPGNAKIVQEDQDFTSSGFGADLHSLIVAKANRLRVSVKSDLKGKTKLVRAMTYN